MAARRFNHMDMRVKDLKKAKAFYGKFMKALGFTRNYSGKDWAVFASTDDSRSAQFFAITEERGHKPNSNRVAFWAGSKGEMDRIAAAVRKAGAGNIEGPMFCPEYAPNYYAVFFEDPSGNRLEVCCRVPTRAKR